MPLLLFKRLKHQTSVRHPVAASRSESDCPGHAFTLIELLAVIAVVGILTALLLPALSRAKGRARSVVCANHLRQMGWALQMYVDDHQGRYPYLRNLPDGNPDNPDRGTERWWFAKLMPYYRIRWTDQGYHCPGYKGAKTGVGDGHDPLGSYAYNSRGVRPPFSGYSDPQLGIELRFGQANLGLGPTLYVSVPGIRPARPEPQVAVPSQMFEIGESRFLAANVNGLSGGRCDMTCGCLTLPRWNEFAFDPGRHGDTYNQLFCDGHVAAMNPWVLFNPTNTGAMWNYDHEPHPELWCPDY